MAAGAELAVSATVRKCTNLERLNRSGLSHDSRNWTGFDFEPMNAGVEFCSRFAKLDCRYKSGCSRSEGVGLEMWNGGSREAGKGWRGVGVGDLGGGTDTDKL